jgi:TupA-like ATPgrasp
MTPIFRRVHSWLLSTNRELIIHGVRWLRILGWLLIIHIVRRAYNNNLQRPLNLFRPRRFTEKMQWRKLFDLDPVHVVFCDKVATREYVAQRVGSEAIVPILWLGSDPGELPFETLRPPYIIKCSHGSGWNIVVRDSDTIDRAAIRTQLANWLATDFGMQLIEPGYSAVPRRLLVEPLLTHRGGFPMEYKFFTFNGVARLVMLRANYGDQAGERTQAYYDMQWRQLPLRTTDMPWTDPVPCPLEFDTMRIMAERLAADRDHLRVDFLVGDGRVCVGELTSYHRSGLFCFEPDSQDFVLGEWWQLERPFSRALRTIITRDWGISP